VEAMQEEGRTAMAGWIRTRIDGYDTRSGLFWDTGVDINALQLMGHCDKEFVICMPRSIKNGSLGYTMIPDWDSSTYAAKASKQL